MSISLRKNNAGFSLVELMIAMMLGLFLMAGIIQLFIGSTQTYSVVTSQSQSQESGRFGLFFLTRSLRHTGYWGEIGVKKQFNAHEMFEQDAVVSGSNDDASTPEVQNGTDELYVRMTGAEDGNMQNCLGESLTQDKIAIDHYFIGIPQGNEKASSLFCASQTYNINTTTYEITIPDPSNPAITNIQPLLNGIENMQILYGISSSNEAGIATTAYLSANNIPANKWNTIQSIKVALLSTSNESTSGIINNQTYTLLDQTVTVNDKRPRMVFQQLVSLRNAI
jgi:type IV pilus assembly protein PilW